MSNSNPNNSEWIHLTTGKEFSRLLYPNPVCFLSTIGDIASTSNLVHSASLSEGDVNIDGDDDHASKYNNKARTNRNDDNNFKELSINTVDIVKSHDRTTGDSANEVLKNVMILSWLTPTNNLGRFMFSIHKTRYSASLLAPPIKNSQTTETATANTTDDSDDLTECRKRKHPQTVDSSSSVNENATHECTRNYQTGIEFALSVPVKGMEQLVLDVGSISGKFGSKFPPPQNDKHEQQINNETAETTEHNTETVKMSNRQLKKLKKQQLSTYGVPGLVAVPLGHSTPPSTSAIMSQEASLFAIQGTVAHLKCRTYAVMGTPSTTQSNEVHHRSEHEHLTDTLIDEDHLLVMAEVIDAHVDSLYWDPKKMLFRPLSKSINMQDAKNVHNSSADAAVTTLGGNNCGEGKEEGVSPYLTFCGSQTFGYVVADIRT